MKHPSYAPSLSSGSIVGNYSWSQIIFVQLKMLQAHLNFHNFSHPFASQWYTWPLKVRGHWYQIPYLAGEDFSQKKGILFVGNPVILLSGFIAIVRCIWLAMTTRTQESIFISSLYLGLFLFWGIIPRETAFYYYYFPAAMILSLAIVQVFRTSSVSPAIQLTYLLVSFVFFAIAYPLLAGYPVPIDGFNFRRALITFGQLTSEDGRQF